MTRLVRIELLKLRTTRLTYGLGGVAAGLSLLFSMLEAALAGGKALAPLSSPAGLTAAITTTGFAMLLAAVLGATLSTGEFRHGTATLTYLATPDRTRVLIAKCIAAACVGAIFGLAASLITTAVGLIFVAVHGDPVALGAATILRYGSGAVLGAALLAVAGVGVGSLVRAQLGAIIGIFVWGIIVESVLGGLFLSMRPYLPYTAATTLAGAKLGGAAFGPAHGLTGGSALPFAAAATLVAGVAILICSIATVTTVHRDIT